MVCAHGSPTSSPTSPVSPHPVPQSITRRPLGSAWRRVSEEQRGECDGLYAECAISSQRDVSTDKTAWLLSWLQWKCLRFSPSAVLLPAYTII
ncbi:hypothetical protein EYF80_002755 [Liparis tanakae]|uniref:Uncharacterized protein n=1 Tax=Liparis tanakae TaxID=230148 RepID=A0A4Z2JA61_9TELE|nr:hypothetical protein EYF80_002755 [Liparis tanakae]